MVGGGLTSPSRRPDSAQAPAELSWLDVVKLFARTHRLPVQFGAEPMMSEPDAGTLIGAIARSNHCQS